MRVFGIDCGTDCTGYGVVEWAELGVKSGNGSSREPCLVALASGGIRLPKGDTMPRKLGFVYRELMLLLEAHRPEVVAIEEVFYSANVKSALKLGQVRGVALLAAANCGLPVAEYAPLKIKSSVVGYGLAQKEQVQYMVTRLLRLECVPEPADAADALAVAICHLHTQQTLLAQAPATRVVGR
jgi:crossover junction endodeoxyribonuclease RuvC